MKPTLSQRVWKRPNDVAKFPKMWYKFTAKDKNSGQLYKIRIQDIVPTQYNEVWDIYRNYMYMDDKVLQLLNFHADNESMAFAKRNFDKVVNQNMSIVAVLDDDDDVTEQNNIVGCLLLAVESKSCDTSNPSHPIKPAGVACTKFEKLMNITRANINIFEKLNIECVIEEHGLVVKREYRRLQVGTELFKTMERIGEVFRIPAASVTLGNHLSQALVRKIGFNLLNEVKLTDFVDEEGKKILPTATNPSDVIQFGYFKYF